MQVMRRSAVKRSVLSAAATTLTNKQEKFRATADGDGANSGSHSGHQSGGLRRRGRKEMMMIGDSAITQRAVMLALAVVGGAGVVHAGPAPHLRSGVVGIARLQTARLTAVRYQTPLRDEVAPAACTVTLGFNRANGTPYLTREGRPIQRQVALIPDGSVVLDLRAVDVFIDDPNIRAAFSASVRMQEPDGPDMPAGACGNVVVSLDIFDTVTGRSSLFLAHPGFVDDPNLIDDPNIIPATASR